MWYRKYADDNTPYNFNFSLDNVTSNLEKSTNSPLNCFRKNYMKANADKCNLLSEFWWNLYS